MGEFSSADVGEIAGMRVAVAGRDVPGPETLVLPSGLSVVTENALPQLISSCRQFDADHLVSLVAAISGMHVSDREKHERALLAEGADPQGLLRDYQMALVLKLALADPERSEAGGRKATPLDLARLCRLVVSSRCDADLDEEASGAALLLRMAYHQFWDMEGLDSWPRGIIMAREMADLMSPADRYDINLAFAGIYGLPFDTFIFLSFALFSMATHQPGRRFGVEQFLSSPDLQMPEADVAAFLDLISSDLDTYRERANDPQVCLPGFDMYNLNPLVRWPAIRHRAGGVTVPIPRLLLDRVTTGVYYDFLLGLDSYSSGRFGNFWGKAFERYVGRLLETTPGLSKPQKGEQVISDGKVCDWFLPGVDRYLIVECKTRGLGLKSKTTGEEAEIRKDILARLDGSSLPGGIAQLAETKAALEDRGAVSPEAQCVAAVVTLDEIYFANHDVMPIAGLLREGAALLTNAAIPYVHIASASGIERLCHAVEFAPCDALAALAEKTADPQTRQLDLRTYLSRRFKPPRTCVALHREFLDRKMRDIIAPFRRPV